MTRSKLSIAVYISLVFLSGALVGGLGHQFYTAQTVGAKAPEDPRKQYLNEVSTRLKLRGDQVKRLNVILDETHSSFRELRKKWAPEVKAIEDARLAKMKEMLDGAQWVEFEKMRQERNRRRVGK